MMLFLLSFTSCEVPFDAVWMKERLIALQRCCRLQYEGDACELRPVGFVLRRKSPSLAGYRPAVYTAYTESYQKRIEYHFKERAAVLIRSVPQ